MLIINRTSILYRGKELNSQIKSMQKHYLGPSNKFIDKIRLILETSLKK